MPIGVMIRRIILLLSVIALVAGALGFAVADLRGAAIAEALAAAALVLAAFRAESSLLGAYHASGAAPAGVEASLARVLEELGGSAPRVRVFDDPSAGALVARSPASPGVILLSRGLLGLLGEDELRRVLRESVLRARSRGIRFQTFCAWAAHQAFRFAPQPWVRLMLGEVKWHEGLGAVAALRFLILSSIARFFTSLGRSPRPTLTEGVGAPLSYVRSSRWVAEPGNPGSCILHLVDPWASRTLFPL